MTRICLFSPIPYSFLHQRPQKLADQFVARGIDVTFIEPCGLTEYLHGGKKGLLRLTLYSLVYQVLGALCLFLPGAWGTPPRRGSGAGARAGLTIVPMPIVYPSNRVDSPLLEKFNASVFRQALRHRVLRTLAPEDEVGAIVQNPFWGGVVRPGDFNRLAYDCLDELTLFAGRAAAERFAGYERDLLGMASATFVTADVLERRLRTIPKGRAPVRVPNGVDYDWFQERALAEGSPEDLRGARPPVAGYVGVLRDWFDYDLVGDLARAMTEVTFVIVGPLDFPFRNAHLRTLPNLHWLGRKPYDQVPRYIRSFDVCLIPFRPGKVSETTNPVKVFEYFALGKPVVASPMHELVPYRDDGLLRLAEGGRAFAEAVTASLHETDASLAEMRRGVARAHSWHALADLMLSRLEKEGAQ